MREGWWVDMKHFFHWVPVLWPATVVTLVAIITTYPVKNTVALTHSVGWCWSCVCSGYVEPDLIAKPNLVQIFL